MASQTNEHDAPLPDDVAARLVALAERLRRLRADRGLRLADLATITGVSQVHLYRLEQGERWPSMPMLFRLASAYGIEPADLIEAAETDAGTTEHDGRAIWTGPEDEGTGVMVSHAVHVRYDKQSRLTPSNERPDRAGSPEELVGMALAGCFSMSLSQRLSAGGMTSERIITDVQVRLRVGLRQVSIAGIHLVCKATVPGIADARFQELADATRRECVVARALRAVPVTLEATLE